MKQILLATLILLSLGACKTLTQPEPMGLRAGLVDGAPPGSPGFRYGWKDGCTSGMAANGSMQYKVAYDYIYDSTMLDNQEYYNAWQIGFRHCRWYTESWLS